MDTEMKQLFETVLCGWQGLVFIVNIMVDNHVSQDQDINSLGNDLVNHNQEIILSAIKETLIWFRKWLIICAFVSTVKHVLESEWQW